MQKSVLNGISFVFVAACFGCGGQKAQNGSSDIRGGTGAEPEGGQPSNSGGNASNSGTLGGKSAVGGTADTGATQAGGAKHWGSNMGGSAVDTGGMNATGGLPNMGGTRTADSSSVTSTGGTRPSPSTGGSVALGGGGASLTGGTTATGGAKSTAGTTALGGALSGGATNATGGAMPSGGTSPAGGTLGTGTAPVWPKKFCGNLTTLNQVDPPGLIFTKYWDQLTPENQGKWASVQSSVTSAFDWSRLDTIYAYAEQNGIIFKEYALIWGSAQPSGSSTGAGVENWIKAYCERYPKTALIDVVNEPPPHTTPGYASALGTGESGAYPWITKSFKLARQYCGRSPVLILNDYNNIEYASEEDHFIAIVKDIIAAGAPIDAVGAQAHYASSFTASQLQANLERLHTETGLPIYITEYDVDKAADADQLAIFEAQFPLFWSTEYVRGITIWGWIYGKTRVTNSGLVNGVAPRPAMTWLMSTLSRPIPE